MKTQTQTSSNYDKTRLKEYAEFLKQIGVETPKTLNMNQFKKCFANNVDVILNKMDLKSRAKTGEYINHVSKMFYNETSSENIVYLNNLAKPESLEFALNLTLFQNMCEFFDYNESVDSNIVNYKNHVKILCGEKRVIHEFQLVALRETLSAHCDTDMFLKCLFSETLCEYIDTGTTNSEFQTTLYDQGSASFKEWVEKIYSRVFMNMLLCRVGNLDTSPFEDFLRHLCFGNPLKLALEQNMMFGVVNNGFMYGEYLNEDNSPNSMTYSFICNGMIFSEHFHMKDFLEFVVRTGTSVEMNCVFGMISLLYKDVFEERKNDPEAKTLLKNIIKFHEIAKLHFNKLDNDIKKCIKHNDKILIKDLVAI